MLNTFTPDKSIESLTLVGAINRHNQNVLMFTDKRYAHMRNHLLDNLQQEEDTIRDMCHTLNLNPKAVPLMRYM